MRRVDQAALVLAPLLLGACAGPSRRVTIAEALHTLQGELRAAGAINVASADAGQFARSVLDAQCEAHAADPEVPVLAHDITVELTGTFTANGGFAVGPDAAGGAPYGLSASFTRAQTQGLTLPITFAALSAVPDVMAAQRITLVAGLPQAGRAVESRRALVERDRLRRRIQAAIAAFRPERCGAAHRSPSGPFQPMLAAPAPTGPGQRPGLVR